MGRKKNNEVSDEMAEILGGNAVEIEEEPNEDTFSNDEIEQAIAEEMETNKDKEEEPKHFEIIEKIKKIETYFNEIDEYFDNISSYQSQNDEYISDLLHYMEVNEFTQASALKFVKLLKEKRIRRRTLNNDWEIKRVFDSGRQRFSAGTDQREMFMASLYKKEKELSYPYNPRQVNFDEIDQLIAVKRGRKSKKDDELIGV